MAFDVSAGLSELGKGVAQTAGAALLEQQKGDLEKQKLALADQLATTREKQRQELERPKQEAETAAYRSKTALSEDEARKRDAAGVGVAAALSGSGGSYANRIATTESGGRMVPNELGSGAYGPYQFMPKTWSDVRGQNADLNLPEDVTKASADQHKAAFDRFTSSNGAALQKAGIEPTPANLYLAHRFGAEGAKKVLAADEGKSLADILPADWQNQNPDMRGQSAGGFRRLADEKMKGVTMEGSATDQIPPELRAAIAAVAKTDPEKAAQLFATYTESRAARTPEAIRIAEAFDKMTSTQKESFKATLPSYIYAESRRDVAQTAADAKKEVAQAQRDFKNGLVPTGDALDAFAYAYNTDRSMPTLGFGGAMGKIAIAERAAQLRKEMGISNQDWLSGAASAKSAVAALNKLQAQQAATEAFSATAEKNGDLVKDLIAKGVGPSGVPLIDKWIQGGRRLAGDDDIGKFGAALYNYLTESAKVTSGAMGNTPLSDSARKEVQDFINKADNEKTILGVIDTMALERQNRMSGFAETIDRLRKQAAGKPNATTETAPGATFSNPNPAPAGGAGGAAPATTPVDPYEQARKAIQDGAPRDAVIKRMRENGLDPARLQ